MSSPYPSTTSTSTPAIPYNAYTAASIALSTPSICREIIVFTCWFCSAASFCLSSSIYVRQKNKITPAIILLFAKNKCKKVYYKFKKVILFASFYLKILRAKIAVISAAFRREFQYYKIPAIPATFVIHLIFIFPDFFFNFFVV